MSDVEVFKFGGTSLADAERIGHVAGIVTSWKSAPVVVVSALAGVTNELAKCVPEPGPEADDSPRDVRTILESLRERHVGVVRDLGLDPEASARLLGEVDQRLEGVRRTVEEAGHHGLEPGSEAALALRDRVLATGEELSSRLVAAALEHAGARARVVDPGAVVRTDDRFGRARPLDDEIRRLAAERIAPLLEEGTVPVIGGFVGATADGRPTTLGRGGSDFTATLLGAALAAARVRIWTDVPGILSGDPRVVDDPVILRQIGFEEAVELSYFGARVIHPTAAKYAVSRGVPLQIRNSFQPDDPGTTVLTDRWGAPHIAAVAFKPDTVLMKVRSHPAALPYGFLARVFEILARHRLPVDLVATSHSSTAFTIDENEEIAAASRELSGFADVEVVRELATITVVGHGLLDEPGINGRVFEAVGRTPVHLISQASDVSISFLVSAEDAPGVVRTIHASLVERHAEIHGPVA